MSVINIPTFLAFVIANVHVVKQYFTTETVQLMDVSYNLLIPL